jgi:hypothetical protein
LTAGLWRPLTCGKTNKHEQVEMTSLAAHHSPHGAGDFLGLRTTRSGGLEIVYDDGVARRMVWRVAGRADARVTSEALKAALDANRVVPALNAELKKRGVAIEAVGR